MIYNFALTHNDLDAFGSTLVLRDFLKSKNTELTCLQRTNYKDLHDKVETLLKVRDNIEEAFIPENNLLYSNPSFHLYIMDVSFSQNKETLEILLDVFTYVTLIDHHMYSERFFDDLLPNYPGFTCEVKQDRCATSLAYEYFFNRDFRVIQKSPYTLEHFVALVNAYDMWDTNSIYFDSAFWLNEYFKYIDDDVIYHSNLILFEKYNSRERINNRGWTNLYDHVVNDILKPDLKRNVSKITKNELLYTHENDVTYLSTFDYFQFFVYNEMQKCQNIVVGTDKDHTRVKVRIKPNVYSEDSLNAFRKALTGFENFGHPLAFSYQGDFSKVRNNLKVLKLI